MAPPAGPGPRDRIRDGDALGRSERLYLDAFYPESANPDAIDHHDNASGSPIPGRIDSAIGHKPFDRSYGDQVDRDKERFSPELVAEIASLEARQADLLRHIGSSTVPDPDFDNDAYREHNHRSSLASPAYAPAEADWFETPMGRHQRDSLIRSVVVPVFFALALPMLAGAGAVLVFAPMDRPDAMIADNGAQSGETDISATASPASIEPTAAALPNGAPQDNTVAAAAPPPNNTPPDNIIETEAPIGVIRIPSKGGVKTLQRRDPRPASLGPVVAPVQQAFVYTESPVAKANTVRFAHLDSDSELHQNAIPPEVIALAPAHFPSAAQSNEPQPVAFAPTSKMTAIEPEAPAQPVIGNVETPSQTTQSARTTVDVNMRAGPNNDEPVITVVLAEAPIEVVECQAWCEVVLDGQRGWIHNRFVDRSGAAADSGSGPSAFGKNPIAAAMSFMQSLQYW